MPNAPLRILAVADDTTTTKAVRAAFPPPNVVEAVPFPDPSAIHTGPAGLSVSLPDQRDAVLIEWDTLRAHEIGALCFGLRTPGTLILAVGDESTEDRIAALAVGADRYHAFPLSQTLLRAQLVAHRRHGQSADDRRRADRPVWARERHVSLGPLDLDWGSRTASVREDALPLTPRQFEVLALFAAHPGEVLSRGRVLEDVWGFAFDTGTNVVDVYVHHLRRVLHARELPGAFQTLRGRGYRLALPQETS